MRPVCVKCKCEMDCDAIGVEVIVMAFRLPRPYQLISADKWKCPGCGMEFVCHFADKPSVHHFEAGFDEKVRQARARNHVECFETPQGDQDERQR